MAVCPHCGDDGAPPRGHCISCGKDVQSRRDTEVATLSFEDLEPITAPDVAPLELETAAPVLQPITSGALHAAADEPPVVQPVSGPVVLAPLRTPHPVLAPMVAPLPQGGAHAQILLSARYEFTSVPAEDPPLVGVLAEIEAMGRPLVSAVAGPVAHVVLALDVSASMNAPDKYPVLREAIGAMLDDLASPDAAEVLLSVVIFSRGADVVLRDVPARSVDRAALFAAIESNPLCFGNYTDVAGALSRSGRIALDQTRANRLLPVRIYLLTDGRPQDIARAREKADLVGCVAADLHALAFGADADVGVLQQLFAGRRGGTVKSVRRETLGDAFERVADVSQRTVATRCVVSIDLAPGVVGGDAFRYRPARVRFPDPAFAGGKLFRADLGTIETGRKYQLLFVVRPPEVEEARMSPLGTLRVQIPGFGGAISHSLGLSLPRTDAGSEPGDVDEGVRTARDILGALTDADPSAALRALRLRRQIYEQERRDAALLVLLDRAIELLETGGSLDQLSPGEFATLQAHTCTGGADRR